MNWIAKSAATAVIVLGAMFFVADKAYDAGHASGVLEGQSDVLWELGHQSIDCTSPRDKDDNPVAVRGYDCKTIYNTFQHNHERFGYVNHKFTNAEKLWDKWFGNRG